MSYISLGRGCIDIPICGCIDIPIFLTICRKVQARQAGQLSGEGEAGPHLSTA